MIKQQHQRKTKVNRLATFTAVVGSLNVLLQMTLSIIHVLKSLGR